MNQLAEDKELEFSVGICAGGDSPGLGQLMKSVLRESDASGFSLRKLVVVASGCSPISIATAKEVQARDNRVTLLAEDERHGKADAVNKIIALAQGEFLIFVNSDAVPEEGAVTRLLAAAAEDEKIGAISGMPITKARRGLTPLVVDLMWVAHNESSITLNHMNLSNHSSDELVLFRSSAIEPLPTDLINDGAYLAITARKRGYAVKVCVSARVRIQTPSRISGLVEQRRRIIFGHRQVWRKTGSPPRTIELLLLLSPSIGLSLLVSALAKRPRLVLALPVAVVSELTSSILSIADATRNSRRHVVWRRVR